MHDVLVRVVMPGPKDVQQILEKDGKTNLVALRVLVDVSTEQAQVFRALPNRLLEIFEVRPTGEDKNADEKNSAKDP
jgi:hypothetical protein